MIFLDYFTGFDGWVMDVTPLVSTVLHKQQQLLYC